MWAGIAKAFFARDGHWGIDDTRLLMVDYDRLRVRVSVSLHCPIFTRSWVGGFLECNEAPSLYVIAVP